MTTEDEAKNGTKVEKRTTLSVGFLTALVSDELVSCEVALAEAHWQKETPNMSLKSAGISKWSKVIDGVPVLAYSTAINEMGQAASAIETLAFLDRVRPDIVILTGIAGSLHEKKYLKSDVVIGSAIHWRTQDRIFGSGQCDEYRKRHHNVDSYDADFRRVLARWTAENFPELEHDTKSAGQFNTRFSEIFTWDYVIDSERVTRLINVEFPQAACVEMESGGFLSAVQRYGQLSNRVPIQKFVVRGISDYASGKDKDKKIRQLASTNAAKVAIKLAEWRSSSDETPKIVDGFAK